jgi:hypothetical protein
LHDQGASIVNGGTNADQKRDGGERKQGRHAARWIAREDAEAKQRRTLDHANHPLIPMCETISQLNLSLSPAMYRQFLNLVLRQIHFLFQLLDSLDRLCFSLLTILKKHNQMFTAH